ncbi:MAG TPA: GntR family transcriptional regulator [Rhizomicrobium sp.]|jgi:GntR family transcriptional regulator|nr:GntR family transcriptional regulator [Rhizomicrobium sp.]
MLDELTLQDNGIPIYVQLRDQLSALVGRGALSPGQRLPTMRQVAVSLRIDLNTVQRAYAELEREGILTLVRGRGTFVSQAPPATSRKADAGALAAKVAAQAQALGISLDDLGEALKSLKGRAS